MKVYRLLLWFLVGRDRGCPPSGMWSRLNIHLVTCVEVSLECLQGIVTLLYLLHYQHTLCVYIYLVST